MSVYPHFTAFFNRAAGGPANGPRYLLDSNLDWGQDVKKLKAWLAESRDVQWDYKNLIKRKGKLVRLK